MLWTDIYLFVRKFIRAESLQCIIGDRAVETSEGQLIGNDGVCICLKKIGCLLKITGNNNEYQNIGTRH